MPLLCATPESVMFEWIRARRRHRKVVRQLYDAIVAQARTPAFYVDYCVPDTIEGRFEMILLHMSLALNRISREGSEGREVGRALVEAFVTEMDDTLREMGISDLGVPRRVRKAAAALRERVLGYSAGLQDASETSPKLIDFLIENLPEQGGSRSRTDALAVYIRVAVAGLDAQSTNDVLSGRICFHSPVLIQQAKGG
jgi:cytochrome b pre-mRNA-processing protein 3